jgi:hypothetical protein
LNHSWKIFWCSFEHEPIGPDPISIFRKQKGIGSRKKEREREIERLWFIAFFITVLALWVSLFFAFGKSGVVFLVRAIEFGFCKHEMIMLELDLDFEWNGI